METISKQEILFVEDEEELRRGVSLIFRKNGFSVTEASNGVACLRRLMEKDRSGGKYDLLVLDIMMPEMTGLDVLEFLHRKEINIPVLLITGYTDMTPADECMKSREIELLNKPFNPSELMEAVHKIIKRSKV
jgi:CheY-like chemotaxis protein